MALTVTRANGGTLSGVGYANPGTLSGVQQSSGLQGGGSAISPQGNTAVTGNGTRPLTNTTKVSANTGTLNTGGNGTIGSGSGSGSGTSSQAAADAAAAAAAAARAAQIRDSITGLAHNIMGVYDSLYGNIDQAGADQARNVNNKYDTEGTGLINQFNQDFPTIGNSFSSRGAYDSSYRQDAESNAQQSLEDQQNQLGQGRNSDLAGVGQFVASGRAQLDSNKGGIDAILAHIGQTTDPNELSSIQSAIQQKLLDAQAQGAQLGTQGDYVHRIQGLVPTQDQTASITANLHSILQGAASPMLKKSVGAKLIQTSGLPDQQKQDLLDQFTSQLG